MALSHVKNNHAGFTLTELAVTVAILGIIAIPFAFFLTSGMKSVSKSQKRVEAQENIRMTMSVLEPIFMEANEITEAKTSTITFICDSNISPTYQLYGDFDGDGIPNIQDTDDDNDANLRNVSPATDQWKYGYDLQDDDDDNDGKVDVKIKIYKSGSNLMKAVSYNEGPWDTQILLQGITVFNITYYGAKTEKLGGQIDTGNDGVPGTADTGENDGLISQREIDYTTPVYGGHGNTNSILDGIELKYIVSFYIELGIDKNRDGREDYRIRTEFAPPLLKLKTIS